MRGGRRPGPREAIPERGMRSVPREAVGVARCPASHLSTAAQPSQTQARRIRSGRNTRRRYSRRQCAHQSRAGTQAGGQTRQRVRSAGAQRAARMAVSQASNHAVASATVLKITTWPRHAACHSRCAGVSDRRDGGLAPSLTSARYVRPRQPITRSGTPSAQPARLHTLAPCARSAAMIAGCDPSIRGARRGLIVACGDSPSSADRARPPCV